MKNIIFILTVLVLMLAGCSRTRHSSVLVRIDNIADSHPDSALSLLKSIKAKSLNSNDRHYLDFLTVKVNDKNYIPHTTDSIILDYIAYADKHESAANIAEAYYYAARVYSDLKDYPSAVKYFHKALDKLPSDSMNTLTHCRILSQTGRLLGAMRLQHEALRYLREVDRIVRKNEDTVNIVHNLHLMRINYMRLNNIDSAKWCAEEALRLSPDDYVHLKAKSGMLLAEVYSIMGRNDTALQLVRHSPELVRPVSRNSALPIAAEIYAKNGINDTAWMYLRSLLNSTDTLNRHNGYRIIFSSSLYRDMPRDSMREYLIRYHHLLDDFYNRNNAEEATLRNAIYNYNQHDNARDVAERKSHERYRWIVALSVMVVVLVMLSIILLERQKRNRLELEAALARVKQQESVVHSDVPTINHEGSFEKLIETLKQNWEAGLKIKQHPDVGESKEYRELKRRIDGNVLMNDNDKYWSNLEELISRVYPSLKETLEKLTDNNLSPTDWHMVMLVKCRIPQYLMSRLLGLSRSAITQRLKFLAKKIFGDDSSAGMITGAILLMANPDE